MYEYKQGWLSPTGEFIECSSYEHVSVAGQIVDRLGLSSYDFKNGRMLHNDEVLENHGWVSISISSFRCHEWRIYWKNHLTTEQKRFLSPYFEGNNPLPVNEHAIQRWKEEFEK